MAKNDTGYIMVDHRASPGIPEDMAIKLGYHPKQVKEGSTFESAVMSCSHCNTQVILNPLRTRERHYCPKCNLYICDWCEAARHQPDYVHRSMAEYADLVMSGKIAS